MRSRQVWKGFLAAAMLTWAARGEARAQAWEKVRLPDGTPWEDPDWTGIGRGTGIKGNLAVDRSGRIYVNNGHRLHVGQRGGGSWQTLTKAMTGTTAFYRERPLGAGAAGSVMWGEMRSTDGGATWDSLDILEGFRFAFAICKDGSALAGGSYDYIERSAPPWKEWKVIYGGRNYGYIQSFHPADNDYLLLAVSVVDGLLRSLDSGKTWHPMKTLLPGMVKMNGGSIRALDFDTSDSRALMVVPKAGIGSGNLLLGLYTVYPQLDTLKAVLPDSPATAMQITRDGAVWIAFRGQGLQVSRDGGRTFTAHNQGLENLFVEDVKATSDGDLYAFTRGGLYRLRSATGLVPGFRGPEKAHAVPGAGRAGRFTLRLGGLPSALQPRGPDASIRVQPDGRMIITPAPEP